MSGKHELSYDVKCIGAAFGSSYETFFVDDRRWTGYGKGVVPKYCYPSPRFLAERLILPSGMLPALEAAMERVWHHDRSRKLYVIVISALIDGLRTSGRKVEHLSAGQIAKLQEKGLKQIDQSISTYVKLGDHVSGVIPVLESLRRAIKQAESLDLSKAGFWAFNCGQDWWLNALLDGWFFRYDEMPPTSRKSTFHQVVLGFSDVFCEDGKVRSSYEDKLNSLIAKHGEQFKKNQAWLQIISPLWDTENTQKEV
ncbi:hypothetical protein [Ferrimonas gelatinilytica]|uniref:Uncharacterized protein n=1 Tax=Ferrimonas gelatinilytica TaxID=1255257 RepID=A0ABP9S1I6_9GAMM